MHIGVSIVPTDTTIQPVALARAVEERGFESLWLPEHSHIPVSRKTPWNGRADAPPLPDRYWRAHDQFVALSACAAVTSTLKLGTGITLVAQHDAIWLAKQVASLDLLSNGRLLFGIGYGWNKEEMADHGVPYTERRSMTREKVLAMKRIWTEDEPSFHGKYVSFEPSWSWPKPVQHPHPPIILGGSAGPRTMRDIVEFCDGWMPIGWSPLGGRLDVAEKLAELRAAAAIAGRDPKTIEIGLFNAPADVDRLTALAEAGVARAVLYLPSSSPETVVAKLDEYQSLAERVGG